VLKTHRTRSGEVLGAIQRARHEYDVLVRIGPWFSGGDAGESGTSLRTPRPLTSPADASIALERCAGDRLDDLIDRWRWDRHGESWTALARAVAEPGRWVGRLHEVTRRRDPEAARRAWDTLLDGARRDLLACVGRTVSPYLAGSIQQRLEAMGQQPPHEGVVVGCHGDLSPGNILADPASLAVVDFEGYHEGLPWEDVGYFLVHLELYFAYPRRGAGLPDLQAAFLEGSCVAPDPVALDACRAGAALKALRARTGAPSWRAWPHLRLLRSIALGSGVS
jgi:hypothetical protein